MSKVIQDSNGIVAVKLSEIIKETGMKQSLLARRAGMTPQDLSYMLHGRKLIKVSDIEKILDALKPYDVTPNELFGRSRRKRSLETRAMIAKDRLKKELNQDTF